MVNKNLSTVHSIW